MVTKYHAVTRGKRPGLYNSLEDARQQVIDFPGSWVETCDSLKLAAKYMCHVGRVPYDHIRVFNRAFIEQGSFIPQPSNSFKQEIGLFASSQQLTREEEKKARVDAIRDEIIYRYLPEGLYYLQMNHPSGRIRLDDDQKLLIYQRVCEQLGKKSHRDIDECIAELKRPPYVNIIDFVDVLRKGGTLRIFSDPLKFCDYTRKNRIDLNYAKESEFYALFCRICRNCDDYRLNRAEAVRAMVRDNNLGRGKIQRCFYHLVLGTSSSNQKSPTTHTWFLPLAITNSVLNPLH